MKTRIKTTSTERCHRVLVLQSSIAEDERTGFHGVADIVLIVMVALVVRADGN